VTKNGKVEAEIRERQGACAGEPQREGSDRARLKRREKRRCAPDAGDDHGKKKKKRKKEGIPRFPAEAKAGKVYRGLGSLFPWGGGYAKGKEELGGKGNWIAGTTEPPQGGGGDHTPSDTTVDKERTRGEGEEWDATPHEYHQEGEGGISTRQRLQQHLSNRASPAAY